MTLRSKLFKCTIPSLSFYVYGVTEEEARAQVEQRIERATPTLSDPLFDDGQPGVGQVWVGYDSTAVTVQEAILKKLCVAAKVDGETLPPFFVRHDPLSGDPMSESDGD